MSDKDLEYKRMTKVEEEYKNTENLAYLYWGIIIAFPIFLLGFHWISVGISIVLTLLSIPLKLRKYMYVVVPLLAFAYGTYLDGWSGGLIVGLGLNIIIIPACLLNYNYVLTQKELEEYEKRI